MKKMICLFMILALMLPVLLVTAPMKAEAAEDVYVYNGVEYATMTSFDYYYPHKQNYKIYSTNPNAKICVICKPYKSGSYVYGYVWVFAIGESTDICVVSDNSGYNNLKYNLPALNTTYCNSNLSAFVNITANVNSSSNILSFGGYMTGGPATTDSNHPYAEPISGCVASFTYDGSLPTYSDVMDIYENYDDYVVGYPEVDREMEKPELSLYKNSSKYIDENYGLFDLLVVNNPSGYDVEYLITVIGPTSCYVQYNGFSGSETYKILSTTRESFNYTFPDEQGLVIGAQKFTSRFSHDGLPDTFNVVYEDFSDFGASIFENVSVEYADKSTELFWSPDVFKTIDSNYYSYYIQARFVDNSGDTKRTSLYSQYLFEYSGGTYVDDSGSEDPDEDPDDSDLVPGVPDYGFEDMDVFDIWEIIENLVSGMGNVPNIFASVFPFLPDWIFWMIGLGIAALVILRFLGR